MHTRRFATLLLGMWLAGSLAMMGVAIGNFQGVDNLLSAPDPSANQQIKVLGKSSARALLRHQVGELNRFYFSTWEIAQICLGLVLIVTLLFATNGEKLYMGLCGFLLLLVIIQHFLLTSHITALGRAIDFLPPDEPSAERIRFWRFHNAYSVLEVIKFVALLVVSGRLLTVSQRSRTRKKINAINDADDG
jgi:hypothetical protein